MDVARQRLRQLGACTEGAHFESNIILDNGQLLASGALLRLRTQEWPDHVRHVLTCKFRPPEAARLAARGIKAREELELAVDDGAMLEAVFRRLGYEIVARYEKVREEWHMTFSGQDVAVALDTAPFGDVVEIEALPDIMDSVAAALGLDKCEISPMNYYELHREFSQSSAPDILFSPADREALRAALHLNA